jgi:two-component system, chemotaxis family, protein-glutamate methylesterase/glutaminase
MTDEIRIILAEDSPTVRHYLASIIEEESGMRVVGEARNGAEAVQLVADLKPDVVSMDIKMPELDGLEATRRIMAKTPTPIVVVSGFLEVDVQLSLQAMEAGALAVVGKPPDRNNPAFSEKSRQLLTTLRAMAGVKVISRRNLNKNVQISQAAKVEMPVMSRHAHPELIAIGASTGGPSALLRLLNEFPVDCPIPLVIVQHMPNEFIPGLARWLNTATSLHLEIAYDGLILEQGLIALAPGATHMIIERQGNHLITRLSKKSDLSRYMPSVDVLFTSVAKACGSAAIGLILTGMGDDGAHGLLNMRQSGAHTFVQDEASSTVFGMPRAAIDIGAVQHIVPLSKLASKIRKLL